jgi:hypothetical protein
MALQTNTIPVFFVHGKADDFVPPEMTRRNFVACKADRQLFLVDNAGHAISYLTDMEHYQLLVRKFLGKCLKSGASSE